MTGGRPRTRSSWQDAVERDYFAYHVLSCRSMPIGGGTDELQRNTPADTVLGLPLDPV
ncbi:MAG: hypothetical protein M0029_11560 [Actinomycetota bacterium]|nr:hypothetical protein [Actinomycetota bacterium]